VGKKNFVTQSRKEVKRRRIILSRKDAKTQRGEDEFCHAKSQSRKEEKGDFLFVLAGTMAGKIVLS